MRGLYVVVLASAVGAGGLATAAEASTGTDGQSGPPPLTPDFTTVIATRTASPAGEVIGPVSCNGGRFTLAVPAGAFTVPVQVILTCGNLAALGPHAFKGFTLVSTLGVRVLRDGAIVQGTFLKALRLTAKDSELNPASVVGAWNGSSFDTVIGSSSAGRVATVVFNVDPGFGFMAPTNTVKKLVPQATTPVTGKPLIGEGILAGILLVLGVGGLGVSRRRRRGMRTPADITPRVAE